MIDEPRIEHRPTRPYLGIAATTSMQQEAESVRSGLRRLQDWMTSRGLSPGGAPFVRYRRIDMPHRLDIEVCVPVVVSAAGDGEVVSGELPAGRYAVLVHTGPVDGLVEANAALQRWAQAHKLPFDVEHDGPSSVWAARTEASIGKPPLAPEHTRQHTEIAYLLR